MPENTLFSFFSKGEEDTLPAHAHGWLREEDKISIARDSCGRHMLDVCGLNWSGLTRVASIWNSGGLTFHFQCWYRPRGPANETDSVAILIQPEAGASIFKVEVTSRGEWANSRVSSEGAGISHRWDSELELLFHEDDSRGLWSTTVRFPWCQLAASGEGCPPTLGDVWRLNLARIIRDGPNSEYLLWRSTFTPTPQITLVDTLGNLFFLGS